MSTPQTAVATPLATAAEGDVYSNPRLPLHPTRPSFGEVVGGGEACAPVRVSSPPLGERKHHEMITETVLAAALTIGGGVTTQMLEAATVPKEWRPFAECVLKRETGGVLHNKDSRETARNRSSSASGRWQMLDTKWREGGSWLVYKRLVSVGVDKQQAASTRRALAKKPIHEWDGMHQDMAFVQSVKEGGWRNWASGGYCDTLAVTR